MSVKEGIDSFLTEIVHAVLAVCAIDGGISQQVVSFFPQISFATLRGPPVTLEVAHKQFSACDMIRPMRKCLNDGIQPGGPAVV